MFQRDYILKMIEMFGEMLAGILAMIRRKQYKKASETIENAYTELLQQSSAEILKIDAEDLQDALQTKYNFNQQQLEIVAGLLFAEAELNFSEKKYATGKTNFLKSLTIFKYLDKKQKTYSLEHQNRIAEIERRIAEISQILSSRTSDKI